MNMPKAQQGFINVFLKVGMRGPVYGRGGYFFMLYFPVVLHTCVRPSPLMVPHLDMLHSRL